MKLHFYSQIIPKGQIEKEHGLNHVLFLEGY